MFVPGRWIDRQGVTQRQPRDWYDADGTQHARGRFLVLFSGSDRIALDPGQLDGCALPVVYARVCTVSLVSFGHYMMGTARIGGQSVTLSGAYGSDGLTGNLDRLTEAARARLVRLTDDETRAYWSGTGGHNSTGTEADTMRLVAARLQSPGGQP